MDPTTTAGERLLDYNHSRLVAVLDSCTAAQEAAAELTSAGFTQSFDVHCGTAGSLAYTANLGGLIRHTEIRSGASLSSGAAGATGDEHGER